MKKKTVLEVERDGVVFLIRQRNNLIVVDNSSPSIYLFKDELGLLKIQKTFDTGIAKIHLLYKS